MISRILVPKDARPPAAETAAPAMRLTSVLDQRKLIPGNLPRIELDPRTSIPAHLPLDVLASRVVVPRDMPQTPLDASVNTPGYVPLTILDSRVAVPKDAHAGELVPKSWVAVQDLPDVLEPDVITTGEVNLMSRLVEGRASAWNGIARVTSIVFHGALLLLIVLQPRLIPSEQPTQAEIDRQTLSYLYLPPEVRDVPRVTPPPQPPSERMRIDPRVLRDLPAMPPSPAPSPVPPDVVRDVPPANPPARVAPAPGPAPPQPQSRTTQPPQDSVFRPIEPPQAAPPSSLVLPRYSPGRALQESLHEALKDGGGSTAQFGEPAPIGPGGPSLGGGGGGGGQGYLGGNLEMLTPTEGVDFSNYLARVLAGVKRNWYAAMPESARLGERGRVILQFRILRNGVVPDGEPGLVATSGKDPLDRAAHSSIRASTPFEPLPGAFSGPYIELRFIFLYNLPLNYR